MGKAPFPRRYQLNLALEREGLVRLRGRARNGVLSGGPAGAMGTEVTKRSGR